MRMIRPLNGTLKRVVAASALLLVAACEPYGATPPPGPYDNPPPQGPYGSQDPYSYPPPNPYPSQPQPYPTSPNPYQSQPYPSAPGQYPNDPYASSQPGYPGQAPYPGQPYQPAPPECPITSSSGWTAWVNAMPGQGGRPTLVVTGKVVTQSAGYQVAFDRYMQIRRGQPPQAFVTLYVAPPEGGSMNAQVLSPHEVRWEWPLQQPVGGVVVRCGDKTLAEITRIQTAY